MTHRADAVTVTVEEDRGPRSPLFPEGSEMAVLVDVVNLGMVPTEYMGKDTGLKAQVVLVFAGPTVLDEETGLMHRTFLRPEFTLSLNTRAKLRSFLKQWFGREIRDDKVREEGGISLHTLVGQPILITCEHAEAKSGRTYARIVSVGPAPKRMIDPDLKAEMADAVATYERDKLTQFLIERAEKARVEYARTRGIAPSKAASTTASTKSAVEALEDDEDELPF